MNGEKIKKISVILPYDLIIVLVWITSTVIFIISPILDQSILRTLFGIFTILFVPGYALIGALFPKYDDLDGIERIALSFGVSIAIVPLIGLFLNFTPFGIKLMPILISLTIFTVFMIILGAYRRFNISENERFSIPFHKIYLNMKKEFSDQDFQKNKMDRILMVLLIVLAIITILMVVYVIIIPKMGEKFTEFYILNSSTKKADNYTTNLKINNLVEYSVGVINREYKNVNYTVEARIEEDILFSKNLTIENDQEWKYNLTIIPKKKGDEMRLKFLLFKENDFVSPYRELHLWVNVS